LRLSRNHQQSSSKHCTTAHISPIVMPISQYHLRQRAIVINSGAAIWNISKPLPLPLTIRQRQAPNVLLLTQEIARRQIIINPLTLQARFNLSGCKLSATACSPFHPLHPLPRERAMPLLIAVGSCRFIVDHTSPHSVQKSSCSLIDPQVGQTMFIIPFQRSNRRSRKTKSSPGE